MPFNLQGTDLFAILVALVINLLILYFLVKSAVSSGVDHMDFQNQRNLIIIQRLMTIDLVNRGMKAANVKHLMYCNEEAFWEEIKRIEEAKGTR